MSLFVFCFTSLFRFVATTHRWHFSCQGDFCALTLDSLAPQLTHARALVQRLTASEARGMPAQGPRSPQVILYNTYLICMIYIYILIYHISNELCILCELVRDEMERRAEVCWNHVSESMSIDMYR